MNYNQVNKCNPHGACKKCKKNFVGGQLCQLVNWKEQGSFCENCWNDNEKKCYWCSEIFIDFKFTDKEKWDLEKYKLRSVEHPNNNIMFSFSHGSGGCFRKECIGHHPQQLGVFCSKDCYDERNGGVNQAGSRYKEWKEYAEKLGWTSCQEKDIFRDWDNHPKLSTYKEEIRKKKGEKTLACNGVAAPGEKYCQYCESDRKVWDLNNEKNWVKNYRDYWGLTNKNNFSNNQNINSESSSLMISNNDNKTEKLEEELIEAKRQRKPQKEIEKLKSKLEKLNNQQKVGTEPAKDNNGLIFGGVLFFGSVLLLGVCLVIKKKKN